MINTKGKVIENCDKEVFIFIFNIIITNKNKTAIAPTYTIINKKEKNSTPNNNSKHAKLKNVNTKKSTECTAFRSVITKNAVVSPLKPNKPNKNKSNIVFFYIAKKGN